MGKNVTKIIKTAKKKLWKNHVKNKQTISKNPFKQKTEENLRKIVRKKMLLQKMSQKL